MRIHTNLKSQNIIILQTKFLKINKICELKNTHFLWGVKGEQRTMFNGKIYLSVYLN